MLVGSVQRLTTKAVRPSPVRSFVPSRVSSVQKSVQQRQVEVRFFKFGNGKSKQQFEAEASLIIDPQCREDYDWDDLEGYFNYMGFLAVEGSNDGMEALLKHVGSPIDCILLLACTENDTPKVRPIHELEDIILLCMWCMHMMRCN